MNFPQKQHMLVFTELMDLRKVNKACLFQPILAPVKTAKGWVGWKRKEGKGKQHYQKELPSWYAVEITFQEQPVKAEGWRAQLPAGIITWSFETSSDLPKTDWDINFKPSESKKPRGVWPRNYSSPQIRPLENISATPTTDKSTYEMKLGGLNVTICSCKN